MNPDWQACSITAAQHTGEVGAPAPYLRRGFTVATGSCGRRSEPA